MKRIGLVMEVMVVVWFLVATASIAGTIEPVRVPVAPPRVGEVAHLDLAPFVSGDNPPTTALVWEGAGGVVVDVVATESRHGAFTVSGVPDGATVIWAYMYEASWESVTTNAAAAVFDGSSLPPVLPFDHDPGWGYGGSQFYDLCAYRWDVSPYVAGNGSYPYSVSWLNQTYGEALVVVYSHASEPRRQIVVNDGAESLENACSNSEFAGVGPDSATLFLVTQADDSSGLAELVSFNGVVILGPGDVFHMNRGYAASLIELPVLCVSGTNAVACSTDEDWFGWHLAVLETYGSPGLVTGGGWIPAGSDGGQDRRTFGFNVHSEGGTVWGQLQFIEHASKIKVHSDTVEALTIHEGDTVASFSGKCRVSQLDGRVGQHSFECSVMDRDEPGRGVDSFGIDIYDEDGNLCYSAGGILGGGNIQIHRPDDRYVEGGSETDAERRGELRRPDPGGVLLGGQSPVSNSPNPFRQSTVISYELVPSAVEGLSVPSHTTVKVYDGAGRLVAALVDQRLPAGLHTVTWNTGDAPSGVYFCKLTVDLERGRRTGNFTATKKLILLK